MESLSEWTTKRRGRGYIKLATLTTLVSFIVIAVVSGYTGAKVESANTKNDPYSTIGCPFSEPEKCPPETDILVIAWVGNRVHLAPMDGTPMLWMKACPEDMEKGRPKWPFVAGDRIISFTFAEDYARQCQYLGKHWGWYGRRNSDGLTDSEQTELKIKGGAL